jgi:hypothetical protein
MKNMCLVLITSAEITKNNVKKNRSDVRESARGTPSALYSAMRLNAEIIREISAIAYIDAVIASSIKC